MKKQILIRGAIATLMTGSVLLSATGISFAKGGVKLPRLTGIISSRPAGKVGTWVIGGRSFTATRSTQLDTVEGPLSVGACAKVRYSGSRAIEIDSEPASDC